MITLFSPKPFIATDVKEKGGGWNLHYFLYIRIYYLFNFISSEKIVI